MAVDNAQAWRPQLWLGVNNREPLTAAGIYQMIARRGRQAGVDAFPHRYGVSARSARARRTYDRIMTDT